MSACDDSKAPAGGASSPDARIEAVARAMWEWMANVQDEGVRAPCFHVPIDHEGVKRHRDAPALHWEKAQGAWRNDMLSMAAEAVATLWTIDGSEGAL